MSKEDVFTLFRFHLWLKIHLKKKQCDGEVIVSNYCLWLYSILLNREQRVNAIKQPTEVFYKKTVLINFTIFTGIHLCWCLFLIKLQSWRSSILLKTDPNTGTLSSEYYEILKNIYFAEYLRTSPFPLEATIGE